MLLNNNRCFIGGRGGDSWCTHSCWCIWLSVCSYVHICFGFERFVCPSVFVFLPPPSSPTPSVSGGRLRNDQSGFDAVGPCPGFLQHMRQLWKPPEPKACDNPVWRRKFDGVSVHLMCNHYPHLHLLEHGRLSHCCILPDVWTPHFTCGRQDVFGSGEGSAVGSVERRRSSSAIIRQDSPEEVRNQHPTWSMLPVLKEYSSRCFCKRIRSDWKDSTVGYNPSLITFNGLFAQQPFHINQGSSPQLGYNMLTKWRLLISYLNTSLYQPWRLKKCFSALKKTNTLMTSICYYLNIICQLFVEKRTSCENVSARWSWHASH